jgi:hypothetical protein
LKLLFGVAMEAKTQLFDVSFYQRELERFYNDLIDFLEEPFWLLDRSLQISK